MKKKKIYEWRFHNQALIPIVQSKFEQQANLRIFVEPSHLPVEGLFEIALGSLKKYF
jgi:hypothetical protein